MAKRTKPGFGAAEAELWKRLIKRNERKIKERVEINQDERE